MRIATICVPPIRRFEGIVSHEEACLVEAFASENLTCVICSHCPRILSLWSRD